MRPVDSAVRPVGTATPGADLDGGEPSSPRPAATDVARLLDALFANSTDAIAILDDDGTIRYATRGVELLFGHDAVSVVGTSVFDFVHPDDVARTSELFARRLDFAGVDFGHEVRIRHSSGRWVPTVVTAAVLPAPAAGFAAITMRSTEGSVGIEQTLHQRIAIAEYCNDLSGRFLEYADPGDAMARIRVSLNEIGILTGADIVDLSLEHRDSSRVERHARWSIPAYDLPEDGPWTADLTEDSCRFGDLLGREMLSYDPSELGSYPIRIGDDEIAPWSLLSSPFGAGGQRGVLRAIRVRPGPEWNDADTELVRTAARIFGRALKMARTEQLLALTYQRGPLGFSIRTLDGELVDCNEQYLDLYHLDRDEAEQPLLADLLMPNDRDRVQRQLDRIRAGEIDRLTLDVQVQRVDGTTMWVRANTVPLDVPGSSEQLLLTSVEDVTEMHIQRIELEHSATHDALTGVANRLGLAEFIERATARDGQPPALIVLDLDRFKSVNDSHGHLVGDEVLRTVAERIERQTRDVDLVARLGGDEFAVVVPRASRSGVERLTRRLLACTDAEIDAAGRPLVQRLSIGVALGTCVADPADLLVYADRALYAAKEQGRNRAVFFDDSLHDQVMERIALERDLVSALDRGEFVVHFQPEFAIPNGAVIGAEALLRWDHPERGHLSAAEFISVAEASGIIDEVGRIVLRDACREFAEATRGYEDTVLRCNLSAREFGRIELIEIVREALEESGLDPHRLCLEMTETTLMESPDLALETFTLLHEIGVTSAIDDFGTGYSSLSYLKRFPVDIVKIDQTFVDDIVTDSDSRAIVESIMSLAETMGLETVAEGVENDEQLEVLRELGCSRAQGHVVSPALSGDELRTFLAEYRPA